MPKYKIYETDATGEFQLTEQPNIVYIPGSATKKTDPELFKSVDELSKGATKNGYNASTASYLLAVRLLQLGMQVLYQGFVLANETIEITAEDWKALEDKNLYNVRFLTTGEFAIPTKEMICCAANRGDCVALVDHSKFTTYSVEAVREAIEDLAEEVEGETTNSKDPLSFASAFTPWFTTKLSTPDGGASFEFTLPASCGYLLAYARSVQSNPMWKAVAGVFRGVIPELKDVTYKLNNAECEMLQARATTEEVPLDDPNGKDNKGIAINPIAYRRYSGFNGGFNYVINGNRTMHENDGNTVATSFLNVRALVTEISKTLYDASVTYTFEQNSDVLWVNFKSLITPLLNKMQSGEGIEGYRLERVPTSKKARLCARLVITPIEAVEDFELEIYLSNSTDEASVTIVQ